ncbi:MAG TPA: Gfo/Idh/MocA family oxidoreductase [Terracidiphilus sp.]|jgi:UDP-N-acetyl-2-amino-2-deoxyglucuronate dehydrogenase|nr:Gfo/Idh/MocA family oxidoreductase [Terracidiphilus sp.]
MRVGIIGTGAIARKHAQAYRNIGFELTACTDRTAERGRAFAAEWGAAWVSSPEELCTRQDVEYVDVCTFPAYRLQAVELCAQNSKHVLVQKPIAIDLTVARQMIETAERGGIQLGVVSQHRFDDSVLFLKQAIVEGRIGKILQADAYVKWYRSAEYYARPVKGSREVEGGGALISQAIHQVDLLLYLVGAVDEVFGSWQLGALHAIESEDVVSAVVRYESGATGVIQASTALWPGYPERIEIHGTRGSAIIAGDQLTTWDVQDDRGIEAPVAAKAASGASDPMAIALTPFERQFKDFAEACNVARVPACSSEDGFRALQLVRAIYASCRAGAKVRVDEVTT